MSEPLAYLLTWTAYGTWLHGDKRGSVDRKHNIPGTPFCPASKSLQRYEYSSMKYNPVILSQPQRQLLKQTILRVCHLRNWHLRALHIRTNHIHIVISAQAEPKLIIRQLKSWCTRDLKKQGLTDKKINWTRNGSVKYLYDSHQLKSAIDYIIYGQGRLMEYYPDN